MKTLSLLIALLFSLSTVAQNSMYVQKMNDAFELLARGEFQKAAGTFDRIAGVEKKEWLPQYYSAYATILISMGNPNVEEAVKDNYLDKASKSLDALLAMAPEEPEIYALQALYFTGRMLVNPMVRAPEYGTLSEEAIQKALKLDPKNPSAKQLRLSNRMGTARFFGEDLSSFCKEAFTLIKSWDNYSSKSK